MKMRKMQEIEIDVEKYTYKNITIWFEDDYFFKRSESLAENIAIILERNEQIGDSAFFLYDLNRLYSIDSTEDIFYIIDNPEDLSYRDINETENIELFLGKRYDIEDILSNLCDPQNSEKLCEKIIDEMLAKKNAVLTEDDTVITID